MQGHSSSGALSPGSSHSQNELLWMQVRKIKPLQESVTGCNWETGRNVFQIGWV